MSVDVLVEGFEVVGARSFGDFRPLRMTSGEFKRKVSRLRSR
jgi:hypothetical protein